MTPPCSHLPRTRYNTPSHADVVISFQTLGQSTSAREQDAEAVMAEMKHKGFGVTDLVDNELGKVWNGSFVVLQSEPA